MAFSDDVLNAARQGLGEQHRGKALTALKNEVFRQWLRPKLRAYLYGRLDNSAEIAAREAAETTLRVEADARKAAEAAVDILIDENIGGV